MGVTVRAAALADPATARASGGSLVCDSESFRQELPGSGYLGFLEFLDPAQGFMQFAKAVIVVFSSTQNWQRD